MTDAACAVAPAPEPAPTLSVVIATYNRPDRLERLLADLEAQTIAAEAFEVIVIDDGSTPPAADAIGDYDPPYALELIRQPNAGPAGARHRGILAARGDIVVIVDDDMQVAPGFLASHRAEHSGGADVVLGRIQPADQPMALFGRFHNSTLTQRAERARRGETEVPGSALCTGNVSMRRALYLSVGGFDASLRQSEDRELGLRFEQAGARIVYSLDACSTHDYDHTDVGSWLNGSYTYGRADAKIARKHTGHRAASPWRYIGMVNPVSRPILLSVVAAPRLGGPIARLAYAAGDVAGRLGLEPVALAAATLSYGVNYFSGVRDESGTLKETIQQMRRYAKTQEEEPAAPRKGGALRRFVRAVREDYRSVQKNRGKYHGDAPPDWMLPVHVVKKIGLQMATSVRVMHLLKEAGVPLGPELASRMIRHLYGAEVHWDAQIAPGISIVHGNGLVISHAASVGAGSILFHNVTLGQGIDPVTREVGAPKLEENVHVGPGAVLLGPITVGAGTKIMAGAVLTESVPPQSLVQPSSAQVISRRPASVGRSRASTAPRAARKPKGPTRSTRESIPTRATLPPVG